MRILSILFTLLFWLCITLANFCRDWLVFIYCLSVHPSMGTGKTQSSWLPKFQVLSKMNVFAIPKVTWQWNISMWPHSWANIGEVCTSSTSMFNSQILHGTLKEWLLTVFASYPAWAQQAEPWVSLCWQMRISLLQMVYSSFCLSSR